MKILIFLCLLLAAPAYGAITEVAAQKTTGSSAASVASLDITYPFNVTAGNLICVGGSIYTGAGGQSVTVSDSKKSSFSTYQYADGAMIFISCAQVATSGADTITITPSTGGYIDAAIDEFSGQNASSFLDMDGGSAIGDTAVEGQPTIGITTLTDNALVLSVMFQSGAGTNSISEGLGWTLIGEQEDNGCCSSFSFVFMVAGGAGLQTASWTGAHDGWSVYAISIRPSSPAVIVRRRAIVIQ